MSTMFEDFELNISRSSAGYTVLDNHGLKVAEVSASQSEHLANLGKQYNKYHTQRISLQEKLGKDLFQSFIDREQYQAIKHGNDENGKGLRVLIKLVDCTELSSLPWELLHDGHEFLAHRQDVVIARYSLSNRLLKLDNTPVRILLTVCPSDTRAPKIYQEEIRFLREIESISYGAIKLTVLRQTTKASFYHAFINAIRRNEPFHMWHHLGEAIVDNFNNIALKFGVGSLSLQQLSQILQNSDQLRVATLNLCYVKQDDTGKFTELSTEPKGISNSLNHELRKVLVQCGPFTTTRDIQAIFVDERIQQWRIGLPEVDTLIQRVDGIVDYLHNRFNDVGENALVLLLKVLTERTEPTDACYQQFLSLGIQIEYDILRIDPSVNPDTFNILNTPVVLGFHHNVDCLSAQTLFQTFYSFLLTHGVCKAIQQSRQHIFHDAISAFDWDKSFVLLHTKEDRLIEFPDPLPEPNGTNIKQREQVFISYSPHDKEWLSALRTVLKPLEDYLDIQIWSDTDMLPGTKWQDEIEQALQSAKVAVMLVSDTFLASDFIKAKEMPRIFEAAEKEGLTLIWIPISASRYDLTPVGKFRHAHDPEQPLDTLTKAEQKQVWVQVAHMIEKALNA